MKWKDIRIGHKFADGSKVTQIHPIHTIDTNIIKYRKNIFSKEKSIVLSHNHYLLCDISKLKKDSREYILAKYGSHLIPVEMMYTVKTEKNLSEKDKSRIIKYLTGETALSSSNVRIEVQIIDDEVHAIIESYDQMIDNGTRSYKDVLSDYSPLLEGELSAKELLSLEIEELPVKSEAAVVDKNTVWLPVSEINYLLKLKEKLYSNKHRLLSSYYGGKREAMCVSTNTGRYEMNDLTHHNSVTLRSIIFHALTHSNDISIGLVDLKHTEFTQFKGVNGVVGVANTVREAAELLRVGREVMYKRNKQMAELGIVDIRDFKPKDPSEMIWIAGRELHEDQMIKAKIDGVEQEIKAKDLLSILEA